MSAVSADRRARYRRSLGDGLGALLVVRESHYVVGEMVFAQRYKDLER